MFYVIKMTQVYTYVGKLKIVDEMIKNIRLIQDSMGQYPFKFWQTSSCKFGGNKYEKTSPHFFKRN